MLGPGEPGKHLESFAGSICWLLGIWISRSRLEGEEGVSFVVIQA